MYQSGSNANQRTKPKSSSYKVVVSRELFFPENNYKDILIRYERTYTYSVEYFVYPSRVLSNPQAYWLERRYAEEILHEKNQPITTRLFHFTSRFGLYTCDPTDTLKTLGSSYFFSDDSTLFSQHILEAIRREIYSHAICHHTNIERPTDIHFGFICYPTATSDIKQVIFRGVSNEFYTCNFN